MQTSRSSRPLAIWRLSFNRYCAIIAVLKSKNLTDLPECISLHPTFNQHVESVTRLSSGSINSDLTQVTNFKNKLRISVELECFKNIRKFRLTGSDLDPFLSYIPRDLQLRIPEYVALKCRGRSNAPAFNLHYRKYPFSWCETLTTIAIGLRVLESMVDIDIKYISPYIKGRVGIEILYITPKGFRLPQRKMELDPVQHTDGIFYFCSGGISVVKINKTLNILSQYVPMDNINSEMITDSTTLEAFILGSSIFSMASWNNHSRFLIKEDAKIYVVDPWKRNTKSIAPLEEMTNSIKVSLYVRRRIDQKKEGSCVNASFARMLQTAYHYSKGNTNMGITEQELTPEFALMANAFLNMID